MNQQGKAQRNRGPEKGSAEGKPGINLAFKFHRSQSSQAPAGHTSRPPGHGGSVYNTLNTKEHPLEVLCPRLNSSDTCAIHTGIAMDQTCSGVSEKMLEYSCLPYASIFDYPLVFLNEHGLGGASGTGFRKDNFRPYHQNKEAAV